MFHLISAVGRHLQIHPYAACFLLLVVADLRGSTVHFDEPTLSSSEQLVLDNFKKGDATLFQKENPGVLRAEFLQRLVTGGVVPMKEGTFIEIKRARITGDLLLSYQKITPYVSLKDCEFDGLVDLSWSSFEKGFNLSFGVFHKGVAFRGLESQGPVRCMEAIFEKDIDFRSLRVHHLLDFSGVEVRSASATFAYSRVASVFYCGGAAFASSARFDHMRIEGDASFLKTTFRGRVTFRNTHVNGDFVLDQTDFDLTDTELDKSEQTEQSDPILDLTQLEIDGMLIFAPKKWPKRGIRNSRFLFSNWSPDNLDPLTLLKGADYDPETYTRLETLLRSRGRDAEADQVGMRRKAIERSQLEWYRPVLWWKLLLFLFVGDGYYPGISIAWSTLIVAAGTWIFRRKHMVPRKAEASMGAAPRYSPFWYSLDLFVPAINLESTTFWAPDPRHNWLLVWMRIQRTLGWLVVPIGLLAVSGVLKP
jgi:hypothetical protein